MIRFLGIYRNDYSFTDATGRLVQGVSCDVSFELSGPDAREGQVGSQGITVKADPTRLRFVGKKFPDLAHAVGAFCEFQTDTTKAGKATVDVVTKIRFLEGHIDQETGEFIED